MKRAPDDIWILKPFELFERAYYRDVEPHPLLSEEFAAAWQALEVDPRSIGQRRVRPDDEREHWVFEGPRLAGRPRLQLRWIIDGREVLLGGLNVVWPAGPK